MYNKVRMKFVCTHPDCAPDEEHTRVVSIKPVWYDSTIPRCPNGHLSALFQDGEGMLHWEGYMKPIAEEKVHVDEVTGKLIPRWHTWGGSPRSEAPSKPVLDDEDQVEVTCPN